MPSETPFEAAFMSVKTWAIEPEISTVMGLASPGERRTDAKSFLTLEAESLRDDARPRRHNRRPIDQARLLRQRLRKI